MTDKILSNLILLSQHVCDSADHIAGTPLADRISDLGEYLEAIRVVRDMLFPSDNV